MTPRIVKLFLYAMAGWAPGGQRRCVLCNHKVWRFMPYRSGRRSVAPLMSVLDVVGSDVENFECPRCGAHDRERHLLLYMRASGLMEGLQEMSILHFAPEIRLSRLLRAAAPESYLPCDLFPRSPDVLCVDMQEMQFESGTFDLVMANHVLEHVDDVSAALCEIFRVLKPGGFAILQTPFSPLLHNTWSDQGIDSPEARLQAYGQEDHVRLFGRDIFEILVSTGFQSFVKAHAGCLGDIDVKKFGVNPEEPFFLFRRPV